jgi:hypothetical protein
MANGKTTVGLLTAFGVGFVMGAQSGKEGLGDIVNAAHQVAASDEFADLIMALRTHVGESLQELGKRVRGEATSPITMVSLLENARSRFAQQPTDSKGIPTD